MSSVRDPTIDPLPSSPFGWPLSQEEEEFTLSQQVLHAVIDAAFPIPSDAEFEPEDEPQPIPADAELGSEDEPQHSDIAEPGSPVPSAPSRREIIEDHGSDAGSDSMAGLSSPPPVFEDEAEEYDSPPNNGDSSESDLTSVDGDDCNSNGARSSDGDDSEGSVKDFVRDDRLPSSSPPSLPSDEEEEAMFTQQSNATQDPADARVELMRAWFKPNDEWRPSRCGSSPTPSSPSPKRGRPDSDDEESGSDDGYVHRPTKRREEKKPKKGKGRQKPRRRSPSPSPGKGKGKGKGKERRRSPTPESAADEPAGAYQSPPSSPGFTGPFSVASTSERPMNTEPRRKSSVRFRPSIGAASSSSSSAEHVSALRVVCKVSTRHSGLRPLAKTHTSLDNPQWIHDDRSFEPLGPWTHQDSSAIQNPGLRLLQTRRLSDGTIQMRFFPAQWVSVWNLKLRRPVQPPQCPGCCDEAP
ncbi:hypothetical protein A4X13_0g7679 [Tilletia indica]|uniref:Uncharacterized protein n=1 Tax=Tilletia indica TaxID=43049 RepID=A0A177TLF5_9BASI|nr:hypothetical protein A4X13_0g7679 [Tilletia indica]